MAEDVGHLLLDQVVDDHLTTVEQIVAGHTNSRLIDAARRAFDRTG